MDRRDLLSLIMAQRSDRPATEHQMQGLPHFLSAVPGDWWQGGGPPRNVDPNAPPTYLGDDPQGRDNNDMIMRRRQRQSI